MKHALISVLIISLFTIGCTTTVKIQSEPSGVEVIYDKKNLGPTPVQVDIPDSIFQPSAMTFKKGDVIETANLERRIRVLNLLGTILFVPLIWAVPPKEDQLVILKSIKGGGPGYQPQLVSGFKDSLVLKNGQRIDNCKTAITGDSVVVTLTTGQTLVYPKTQVDSVKRGN